MFFVFAPFMMAQNAASASFWLKAISGLCNQMELGFYGQAKSGYVFLGFLTTEKGPFHKVCLA
jgi:hypothetical protein